MSSDVTEYSESAVYRYYCMLQHMVDL